MTKDTNDIMQHHPFIDVSKFANNLFNVTYYNGNMENTILCPISVFILLSAFISSGGPKRSTANQICKVLTGSDKYCNKSMKSQLNTDAKFYLNSLTTDAIDNDKSTMVQMSNAAFLQQSITVRKSFKTKFPLFENDLVKSVDFMDESKSRVIINEWINNATNGFIKTFYEKGKPSKDTLMVLLNTIYFQGKWEDPFLPDNTVNEEFLVSKNEKLNISMMVQSTKILYHKSDKGYYLIAKNYTNTRFKFVVILPTQRLNLHLVTEHLLKGFDWKDHISRCNITNLQVILPRFYIKTTVDMKPVLQSLGITDMFSENANLTGITATKIKVDDMKQDVMLDVREEGVKAAAITSITSLGRNMPTQFIVDQPFYCAIYDSVLELALFIAKVVRPEMIKEE